MAHVYFYVVFMYFLPSLILFDACYSFPQSRLMVSCVLNVFLLFLTRGAAVFPLQAACQSVSIGTISEN